MAVTRRHSASQLGLGCVTFGREIDRATAFAMLDHAISLGWTHLDTAAAYGGGASETIVGEWLALSGARSRVTVATKVLPPYSAASIELSVRQSLERLQIDAIDLLYLHRWDATADPETLAALNAQVRGGRVRAFAASNFDNAQLEDLLNRCDREGLSGPRALQNVNNLALRSVDATTRRLCSERDIAIVTYSPLGAGFLTGKYSESIPAGSRFAVIPGHQPLYFTPTGRARLERLQTVALRVGLPTADLALAWALHQPQVATVLVGGRCRAQLDRAAQAQSLDFPEVFADLEADAE